MPTVTMLNQPIIDKRAWRADTIDEASSWYHQLTEPCLAELDAWVQAVLEDEGPITDHYLQAGTMQACAACLKLVRTTLFQERGFVVINQIPEHYTVAQAKACYWGIGQFLGRPLEQNIQGTLLYSVQDTGQNISQGVRFSVTNSESSFHTDGAFWDEIPDLIGLLCLATAKSGGENQLISGYTIHNELLENARDALQVLYQDYYFDRRGGVLEGESSVAQHPIFTQNELGLTFRYLNYYIHVAHEKVNQPLTTAQENALLAIENLLKSSDLQIEFSLKPGQMLFTNNHWILHNRTAFVDYEELERRRHYVRLWLQRN